jgi:hypothetical protein
MGRFGSPETSDLNQLTSYNNAKDERITGRLLGQSSYPLWSSKVDCCYSLLYQLNAQYRHQYGYLTLQHGSVHLYHLQGVVYTKLFVPSSGSHLHRVFKNLM